MCVSQDRKRGRGSRDNAMIESQMTSEYIGPGYTTKKGEATLHLMRESEVII